MRRGSIDLPLARRTRLAGCLNRASSNVVWAKATRAFVTKAAWQRRNNAVALISGLTNTFVMSEDNAPWGSVDSYESSQPERPDAPAAWKLNNCTLMVDQSVWFVAAACLQKARLYTNQMRPANRQWVQRISSGLCSKSFSKASNQLVMSSTHRLSFKPAVEARAHLAAHSFQQILQPWSGSQVLQELAKSQGRLRTADAK